MDNIDYRVINTITGERRSNKCIVIKPNSNTGMLSKSDFNIIQNDRLYQLVTKYLNEDTVKQNGKWVNKGKEGTHGEFKTKKEADAQRRAMFSGGYKAENLKESKKSRKINEALSDDLMSGCYITSDGYIFVIPDGQEERYRISQSGIR